MKQGSFHNCRGEVSRRSAILVIGGFECKNFQIL